MTRPIDVVLDRLQPHALRSCGRDRWRACCPAHGGSNPTALSISLGSEDRVLLRCWQGCGATEIAESLGLQLGDLFPVLPRDRHWIPRQRGLIAARQALDVIEFEAMLVWTAAFNLANGHALTADDLSRLALAGQRIQAVIDEARK